MGTINNDKKSNKITISRGGDVPARKINPESGQTDRSFAQPNPTIEHPEPAPKVHASEQDETQALEKNSKLGRKYKSKNKTNNDGN